MSVNTLEIHFRGICTHFHHNFIPGVPHRVVLPNAINVFPGLLTGPFPLLLNPPNDPADPTSWIRYFLMPHVPIILDPAIAMKSQPFVKAGLFAPTYPGFLITPSRLHIVNAIDSGISYPGGSFTSNVPHLTKFYSDYIPSDDVISGGRASAYFDLYGGSISSFPDGENIRVKASIATDGPPQLQVTPIGATAQTVKPVTFTLPTTQTLLVGNLGIGCEDGVSSLDFLLHYLTSRTGIPRELTEQVPGMGPADLCPPDKAADAFKKLADWGFPNAIPVPGFDLSAACSDSRYP